MAVAAEAGSAGGLGGGAGGGLGGCSGGLAAGGEVATAAARWRRGRGGEPAAWVRAARAAAATVAATVAGAAVGWVRGREWRWEALAALLRRRLEAALAGSSTVG